MLSNLISQLKQQDASDRLNEVLSEVPNVRKDLSSTRDTQCQIVNTSGFECPLWREI